MATTVKEVRDLSREGKKAYAIDALGRRNYAKDGKLYTESYKGSGNFYEYKGKPAAAKQWITKFGLDKQSSSTTPKPKEKPTPPTKNTSSGKPGESKMARDEAAKGRSYRPANESKGGRVRYQSKKESQADSARTPVNSSGESKKSTGSNMVFSPMLGKMVPDQRPALKALPTDQDKKKKSKSWLDNLFESNWEKYNK